jgi:hypothetical protein
MPTISKFHGLRNTTARERFKPGDLDVALDVDIDTDGALFSRDGYSVAVAGAAHSLWADGPTSLFAQGASLYRLQPDLSTVVLLRSDLTPGLPIAYEAVGDTVFYSNGTESGVYDGLFSRALGVVPPPAPTLAAGAGSLPPGRYLATVSYLRDDGHESGTAPVQAVTLNAVGGVSFSGLTPSTNPLVSGKILYLSTTDGETLYRAGVIGNGVASSGYTGNGSDLRVASPTLNLGPMPAGTMLTYHAGRLYVVAGRVVWFSEAYQPELCNLAHNFIMLPRPVTMIGHLDGGLFVATDTQTDWWGGTDPLKFQRDQVLDYGAIPGTMTSTDGELYTAQGLEGNALVWLTPRGICVGVDGGKTVNLTDRRFHAPSAARGGAAMRRVGGFHQYLSVLPADTPNPNVRA